MKTRYLTTRGPDFAKHLHCLVIRGTRNVGYYGDLTLVMEFAKARMEMV